MSLSANLRVALFLFAGSCFTLSTHAAAVSQDQAELAAAMLMNSAGFSAAGPVRTVGMAPLGDGTPALWLVQFPSESFVWLRNEDGLPPVAGWGLAAGSELPDGIGLSDWLELQRLDVSHARQEGWQHPDARDTWSRLLAGESPSRDGQNVDPMLACLWVRGHRHGTDHVFLAVAGAGCGKPQLCAPRIRPAIGQFWSHQLRLVDHAGPQCHSSRSTLAVSLWCCCPDGLRPQR
jgi:hypothetical protein